MVVDNRNFNAENLLQITWFPNAIHEQEKYHSHGVQWCMFPRRLVCLVAWYWAPCEGEGYSSGSSRQFKNDQECWEEGNQASFPYPITGQAWVTVPSTEGHSQSTKGPWQYFRCKGFTHFAKDCIWSDFYKARDWSWDYQDIWQAKDKVPLHKPLS